MIRILAYKKFCTSAHLDGKLHMATVCKSGSIDVLNMILEGKRYRCILGFFDVKNPKKLNKSLFNGMYQKGRDVKKCLFKTSYIDNTVKNESFIKFLLDHYNTKTNFNITDVLKYYNSCGVYGRCKGKGFAGVIKRHGFSGLGASHGVTLKHRSAGSTGSRNPNHTIKGQKMAGRIRPKIMIRRLKIIRTDAMCENTLAMLGSLPGGINTILELKFS